MSRAVQWNDGENTDKKTAEGKSSIKNGVRSFYERLFYRFSGWQEFYARPLFQAAQGGVL